jgi:hypothetical protein
MTAPTSYLDAFHAEASVQPFGQPEFAGTPLEYHGSETLEASVIAIDWLLLSVHTGPSLSSEVWRQAVLLRLNGTIIDGSGSNEIELPVLPYSSLWIVLRDRNHLGVMSSAAVDFSSGTGTWNFRANQSKAYSIDSPGMKLMPDGKAVMYAGDITHDGEITASDFNEWLTDTKAVETGYLSTDLNCDAQVTATDFNRWLMNTKLGMSQQIPN